MTPRKRQIGFGVEQLGERVPFAVDVFYGTPEDDGSSQLIIRGDAGRNVVRVTQEPEYEAIAVHADGRTHRFPAHAVDSIFADLGAGNDVFETDADVRTVALGRQGDDLLHLMGHGRNRINGGRGQDSVESQGSFTVFVMNDRDYDRVHNPIEGAVRFLGADVFGFKAWHRFLSTPNVNAYRGNHIVVNREYVAGYEDRVFFTVDVDANDGRFEDMGGLQQLAEGYPHGESPGGLRLYVGLHGSIDINGIDPEQSRYVIKRIYVV